MSRLDRWANGSEVSIDTIADLLEKTSREHGDGPVEGYHRSTRTRRLEWSRSTAEVGIRIGCEQGGALRWIDPRHETLGFAASSGDAATSLTACRSMAGRGHEKPVDGCPWNVEAAAVEDIDAATGLPSREEMQAWLLENTPETADSAWIEAGLSCETWLTRPNAVQKRLRSRIWALWSPEMAENPMFLAARGWRDWLRLDPLAVWRDRALGSGRERDWPDDAKLVFSPETSAFVARMLATAVHHPRVDPGSPVGPGWVLTARHDDDPHSLFGSLVDDAGFPSTARILADGRHVIDDWGGPGSLRRASFRDSPEPTPASLQLDPPRLDPPKRSAWVSRIELHPADGGWIARLYGRQFPDGAPFRPRWARLEPHRMLESCLGGIGPAYRSHRGMTTPALVFDDGSFKVD